jgi:hypothetical protein
MFAAISPTVGTQPFNDWFAPDTTQRQPLGMEVTAVDPFWGTGVFVYLKSNDAVLKGSVVMWDETYQAALLPSTVTQGFPFAVAMAPAASGTFFWAQHSGRAVYKTNATVAADGVLAVAAAGVLGATATGKQVLGIRNRISATGTVTVSVLTTNGTNVLLAQKGYDGFFLGMALTGTGIGASAVVAGLDPDGKRIYTGTAIGTLTGANQTATGQVTLTGTYTGFGSGILNRPSCMQIVT